ncbi:MAG: ABC transporter ATP-binding protein [Halothiobacillaceae bacterium]
MSAALLQIRDLSLHQGGQCLLDQLNLAIHPGECWAILGRNGAGKTSLLHTLAAVRPVPHGQIELLGQPLNAWKPRRRARHIGLLTQEPAEGFEANVLEAVQSGRHPYIESWSEGANEDASSVQQALATCGLKDFATRRINSLSGGERRRLGIATLLAQNPPLMLLDEPLNHLDMAWQWCILRKLRSLADQGHALMMSLHDPNMALRNCTHALLMHEHGAWQTGRVDELLTPENIEAVYGLKLRHIEDQHGHWLVPDLHAAHAPL